MTDINFKNISIDKVSLPSLTEKGIEGSVLRLDKIHPFISGNKWFKLRYYLEEAKKQNKKTILTFGGAWSNHILATAAACRSEGFQAIGIIRGGEPPMLSPVLLQCKDLGMQLQFISRDEYSRKTIPAGIDEASYYCIPEGGYGHTGAAGAATILDHCDKLSYDKICCACGTGTMIAGLSNAATASQEVIGISVLKNNSDLPKDVSALLQQERNNTRFIHDYHFGGYAKYKPELIGFMNMFYKATGIPSDFVYTGKLFFAVNDMAKNDFFTAGSRLLLIHSGGLSGNSSLEKGMLIF